MKKESIIWFCFINMIFIPLLTPHISSGAEDFQKSETEVEQITEDPSVLIKQAKVMKSKRRFKEAIKLLKSAANLTPTENDLDIKIEIATLLSFVHEYKESIDIFTGILNKDPGNRDARLGLAKTYSWAGMYDSAIKEYTLILEIRPDDAEAKIGISRILSWQGRHDEAINGYRAVLENHPENVEARLGLANVMMWRGDLKGSLEETRFILIQSPDNQEAIKLDRRLREEKGPVVSVSASNSSDSDKNILVSYKTQGYLNLGPQSKLNFEYTNYEASRKKYNGYANIFTVRDSIRISKVISVSPRFSLVRINSDNNDTAYAAGGVSTRWVLTKSGSLHFSYSLSPLIDTVQLMQNDIRVQEYSASVLYNLRDITISAGTSYGDYSDNNSRYDFSSNGAWTINNKPKTITGYILDYRNFGKTPYTGYFSPNDFISMRLYLTLSGDVYTNKIEYNTTGSIGIQSHESKTEDTSSFQAKLIGHLNRYISFDAGYKWSRSSLETLSGYRFEEYRFGLTYVF